MRRKFLEIRFSQNGLELQCIILLKNTSITINLVTLLVLKTQNLDTCKKHVKVIRGQNMNIFTIKNVQRFWEQVNLRPSFVLY